MPNARDLARLSQEQARRNAVEQEVARRQQTQGRSPATNAGRYDTNDGLYNVQTGGRTGQGRSNTNGGIAPGDRVENQQGAGAIDAMPHSSPEVPADTTLGEDQSPRVVILIRKFVYRETRTSLGLPGYFVPGESALYANIYALSKGVDYAGQPIVYELPPQGALELPKRYKRAVYGNERCTANYEPWRISNIPPEIVAESPFQFPDPRWAFTSPNAGTLQEVIVNVTHVDEPEPPLPQFFRKFENTCFWDEEIPNEWKFVESYLVLDEMPAYYQSGIPGGVSLYFNQEFWILDSRGSFVKIEDLPAIASEMNVRVVIAMDANGVVHLTLKWATRNDLPDFDQIHHYQYRAGGLTQVDESSAWNASYANGRDYIPPPDSELDPCVVEYRDESANLIENRLYTVFAENQFGITWRTLTAEGGQELTVVERQTSSEDSVCSIQGEPKTFQVRMPVPELIFQSNEIFQGNEGAEVAAYVGGLTA
jgi:hypothetical protein